MSAHDQSLHGVFNVTTAKFDVDWNAVYRQELPRIYNYFRYRLGDNALAEDLTSAAFSTWLLTIARNVAIDHLRSDRAYMTLDSIQEQPGPGSPHETYARQAE